jgi:AcrR family transcriptional regulator
VSRTSAADSSTRQRLLETATRLFAAHGYRHVPIRTICGQARANVAAVNYHFAGKMGLYKEVLDASGDAIRETTVAAIRAGEGKTPEEQLKAYIRVHCERLHGSTTPSVVQQLVQHEMESPTPELTRFIDRIMKPRFEYLFGVVGALLDLPPRDGRAAMCGISIHGLILMFRPNPVAERMAAVLDVRFSVEELIAHVTAFSLAALESYRTAAPGMRSGSKRKR